MGRWDYNKAIKRLLQSLLARFGYAIHTQAYIQELIQQSKRGPYPLWVPPGHFYSPLPDPDELRADEDRIFNPDPSLPALDLRLDAQRQWLERIADLYPSIPHYPEQKGRRYRYYAENNNFGMGDAITLHAMLRLIQPKRIIEIGSGFSSTLMLDTIDEFLPGPVELTCIDPYPERLHELLLPADAGRLRILPNRVQGVDPAFFQSLQSGDLLFVDSTHVSKTGSDVNHIYFEIFPRLSEGVYIHIHDIFYPFEYPRMWVYEGRAWNEAYLLRAFLMYNQSFQIEFFFTYLYQHFPEIFRERLPRSLESPGDNLWVRKVSG